MSGEDLEGEAVADVHRVKKWSDADVVSDALGKYAAEKKMSLCYEDRDASERFERECVVEDDRRLKWAGARGRGWSKEQLKEQFKTTDTEMEQYLLEDDPGYYYSNKERLHKNRLEYYYNVRRGYDRSRGGIYRSRGYGNY